MATKRRVIIFMRDRSDLINHRARRICVFSKWPTRSDGASDLFGTDPSSQIEFDSAMNRKIRPFVSILLMIAGASALSSVGQRPAQRVAVIGTGKWKMLGLDL